MKNGASYNMNGWKYISIYGSPKDRGYAYGYMCAVEFKEIQKMLQYNMFQTYAETWEWFIVHVNKSIKEKTKKHFPEFYEEMKGIANGVNDAGTKTSIDEIIAWNYYYSIPYWYSWYSSRKNKRTINVAENVKEKCSAFIACGDYTEDGKIVVAHNSFTGFIDGQYLNVVLDIHPNKGHRILMQTAPCFIWSGTDFFITSKGIVGTETTIGGFNKYKNMLSIGCRIRKAMQYGNSLDDYVKILLQGNSGDYANSWLFGNIHTNEIMRLELGLNFHNVERTKNGYYIGFNAAYDPNIRIKECKNDGFYDIRRHQGARRVRLTELMDENKGKINIEVAKKIISDHYDVYLHKKNNPSSRTVCAHYYMDAREYMSQTEGAKPFDPHGAVDGCVTDSKHAERMGFFGRFGNSCGIPFVKKDFCNKHIQYDNYCPYLKDRPSQPWTYFTITPHPTKTHHHKTQTKFLDKTNKNTNKNTNNKTKKRNK
jgi:hypothetical protein